MRDNAASNLPVSKEFHNTTIITFRLDYILFHPVTEGHFNGYAYICCSVIINDYCCLELRIMDAIVLLGTFNATDLFVVIPRSVPPHNPVSAGRFFDLMAWLVHYIDKPNPIN